MPSVLHSLGDLGAASGPYWSLLLGWTVLALAVEAFLRQRLHSPTLGLSVRGALLVGLPALLVLPPLLAPWVPSLAPAPGAGLVASEWTPPLAPMPLAQEATGVEPGLTVVSLPFTVLDVVAGGAVVLAVLFSVAAVLSLCGGLVWLARVRRTLHDAAPRVSAEAQAVASQVGLPRPVRVVSAPPLAGPFTLGWLRPLVAVPTDLVGEPLRLALAHELAHVRHAHFLWNGLGQALRALFVWHPLVHVLARGLALDRERVADAAVLRLWPGSAREYGRVLLRFSSCTAPALALGASAPPLLIRLSAMTHSMSDRPWMARLAGLALLAVPLGLAAASVPDAPPAPEASGAAPSASATDPVESADHPVWLAEISYDAGVRTIRLRLRHGTTEAEAERIADQYAAGDEAGTLEIIGRGVTIRRATLREDAFPPPPPLPAPSQTADAGPMSMAGDLAGSSQAVLDRMDTLLSASSLLPGADGDEIRVVYLTEVDGTPRC